MGFLARPISIGGRLYLQAIHVELVWCSFCPAVIGFLLGLEDSNNKMVVSCCICSALHLDVVQAASSFSPDSDVVDLDFSLAVRGSPGGFFLWGKIEPSMTRSLKVQNSGCEYFAVFVLFSGAMAWTCS